MIRTCVFCGSKYESAIIFQNPICRDCFHQGKRIDRPEPPKPLLFRLLKKNWGRINRWKRESASIG